MVNEEIVGGLISALSRGEPLQKAMMTFFNAGYGKEEIEEAAKVVYTQVGAQTAKTGYLKETIKSIASKVGLVKRNMVAKTPPQNAKSSQNTQEQIQKPIQNTDQKNIQNPAQESVQKPFKDTFKEPIPKQPQEKKSEKESANKDRFNQKVSNYGENNYGGNYQNVDQVTSKIERAIKDLSQIKFPSKIEIVNKSMDSKQPFVVQRVSNYSSDGPPKPVSKVITYVLVFILILLLGVLAAVFFFKEDLIKLFSNFGLG